MLKHSVSRYRDGMPSFAAEAETFWMAPYKGDALVDTTVLRLVVNGDLDPVTPVQVLGRRHHPAYVSVTPDIADSLDLAANPPASIDGVRARLTDAGLHLSSPDLVHLYPPHMRPLVERETPPTAIRLLTEDDTDVFQAFLETITPADVNLAYVELHHWAVMGSFEGDELACVASAYPWYTGPMADIGVVASPWHRGRGHGRRVVRALAARCWHEGYEPQYRTQPGNLSSQAAALSAGLELFGDWECVMISAEEAG